MTLEYPVKILVEKEGLFGAGPSLKVMPAAWGHIPSLPEYGDLDTEVFVLSGAKLRPGTHLSVHPIEYFRSQDQKTKQSVVSVVMIDLNNPPNQTEQYTQRLRIRNYIESTYLLMARGDQQAATEILHYMATCK